MVEARNGNFYVSQELRGVMIRLTTQSGIRIEVQAHLWACEHQVRHPEK